MKLKTARGRLFLFLSLILLLPLAEYNFHFIESGPLHGAMTSHPNVKFSWNNWWDGSYQQQKDLYINDSFGFRPDFVRMNNQMDFELFHKLNAGDVYASSDNYLIGKQYVDEYVGKDYVGEDVMRKELLKLKLVQDTLERLGKTFVFTCAPSKAYVYPEKIPAIIIPRAGRSVTNYETFKRLSDSIHIKLLDFNAQFMAMKDTAKNQIITKEGCHWSVYGSLLAADTLTKYIERERSIKIPELTITALKYEDTARNADNDYAKPINLIFPVTKERFCYPDFHYAKDSTSVQPKTIYIGDSYIWLWLYDGFPQNTNAEWQFWDYFHTMWTSTGGDPNSINKDNWQKPLLDADCIVIVLTPINFVMLDRKSFFIETMYDYFYPAKS